MTDVPLPDMPPGPSPEEILYNALIKRLSELTRKAADLKEEMDSIKARMRALGAGRHEFAVGTIRITPQKRFDPELAEKVLSEINPDLVAACMVSKIDAGKVKEIVGDLVYERCQAPSGEPKVTLA